MPRILTKQESEVRSCGISRVLKNHTATYNCSFKMKATINKFVSIELFNSSSEIFVQSSPKQFVTSTVPRFVSSSRVVHKCSHKLPECQSAGAPGLTAMTPTAVTVRRISSVSVFRNQPHFFSFLSLYSLPY